MVVRKEYKLKQIPSWYTKTSSFFDVCPQQPILIQYKSLVPARELSFDGGIIGIEEHQLNSRQLGTGRVHIVTKARPRPDDPTLLVVENTIVLSFP